MNETESTYLLIIRESTPERYATMSRQDRRQALDRWNEWCDHLAEQGRIQNASPLEHAGRVVSSGGTTAIDGPFTEAKEAVGGYFLLNAASLDEAAAIVEDAPNLEYGLTIEVRPLADACHLARSLGMRTMREPIDA